MGRKAVRPPLLLALWRKYPYRVNRRGKFQVPPESRLDGSFVSLTEYPRMHLSLARVKTEEQAKEFVHRFGMPAWLKGDELSPGYAMCDLLRDAARLRLASRLAQLQRQNSASNPGVLRKEVIQILKEPDFKKALGDNPAGLRARRMFLSPRLAKGQPTPTTARRVQVTEWEKQTRHLVARPDTKPIREVHELLEELTRCSLSGRLPTLIAHWEPSPPGGYLIWKVPTLLDWCWLQFLRSAAGGRVPKFCLCGEVHERRGIYHSEACRNRFKAQRHYARARGREENRVTVRGEQSQAKAPGVATGV